ncbi:PIN domain-containing protein [Sulfolobus tengchongensis]|uniref:PIN domain-containing protein n=1 Tax=Sulfolobus tengchongensis TaxID=207809 RepID=A0AAX4KYA1_9CREN
MKTLILLDTSFLFSYLSSTDPNHSKALEIMNEIDEGKYGKPFITDYIFDEIVTLLMIRKNKEYAIQVGVTLFNLIKENSLALYKIDEKKFQTAWDCFTKYKALSFTDCTSFTILRSLNEKYIASFDRGFDQLGLIRVS